MKLRSGIGAAIFGVGALIVVETLNYSGFCWSRLRHYSDQELIDIAVRMELKYYSWEGPFSRKYESLNELYEQNQNCCSLYRWTHGMISDLRFLGIYEAVVESWFRTQTDGLLQFYKSEIFLNSCGNILRMTGHQEDHARP